MNDWQTWTALAVVVVTAGIFIFRCFSKKKSGCGGGCGCAATKKPRLEPK